MIVAWRLLWLFMGLATANLRGESPAVEEGSRDQNELETAKAQSAKAAENVAKAQQAEKRSPDFSPRVAAQSRAPQDELQADKAQAAEAAKSTAEAQQAGGKVDDAQGARQAEKKADAAAAATQEARQAENEADAATQEARQEEKKAEAATAATQEAWQAEEKTGAAAAAAKKEVVELRKTNKEMLKREQSWEIVIAFFAVVFVGGFIAAFILMRNMYIQHAAKQMTTIVHLNEERVKLFTKIQQQAAKLPGKSTTLLTAPLLPKTALQR